MKKNKGMKIYKQRKKRKGGNNQIVSILGTCAVVFGVGIFGYYVVAVPIFDLITSSEKPESDKHTAQVDDAETTTAQTTYKKIFEDLGVHTESQKQTEAPVTEVPLTETEKTDETTATSVTTAVSSEETSAPVTEASSVPSAVPSTPVPSALKGCCYYLSTDDISSVSALVDKLNVIGECTSVVIPLKTTGGYIHYDSSVETAQLSGAVVSDVSLYDIVSVIAKKGITPIAEISTVADNIYPETYKKSAYQFADGYTGEWLDNRADNGGKPWLSPFSDQAVEYLTSLIDEITAAGIKNIICTDTYFPSFREADLEYIGEIVQSETRYKGLTNLINTLSSAASANGGKVMLSVSAREVMDSSAEVFKPEEFGVMPVVLTVDMSDFSDDSLSVVMNKLSSKVGSMKEIPCFVSDGVSESSAENTFKSAGYDFYIFR